MAALSSPAALRLLVLPLLALSCLPARSWSADDDEARERPFAFAAAATAEAREPGERESPPLRVPLRELDSLAVLARAPEPVARRPFGVGPAGLDWTFLGPRPLTGEYWSGNSEVGGRVCFVAPHPTDPNIVYIAAAQGGVWRTADAGVTWSPLTESLSSLSSGALAIDRANPDILWYGTGEAHGCGDCYSGDGLFQSTDAGAHWARRGTTAQVGSYIARVVPARGTGDTLYVGGNRGLVVSTDGGTTWILKVSAGWCDDIVVDATAPERLCFSINGSGVYVSTDAGASYTRTLALPGRTNLGRSASSPNVIYASASTSGGNLYGAFRSSDGGTTWTTLAGTPDYLGGQGWYDNTITVSPTDSATVFAGGVFPYNGSKRGLVRSRNGGATWSDVSVGTDGKNLHPDQHHVAFGPDGTLWVANDGGVWKSADQGDHWTDCNATLAAIQFYTVAAQPAAGGDLIGGTQDNGSARYQGAESWPVVASGDGGSVMYRRESPATFYTSYVRLNPIYWFDGDNYMGTITGGWAGMGDRADWANAPLVEDPLADATYYAGTFRIWKTADAGTTWSPLGPDLTGGGVLRAIAFSPQDPNQLWTGASDGQQRRSRDGGATWQVGPAFLAAVYGIVPSPADTATAYYVVNLSGGGRIQRTVNGGASFTSVTAGVPSGVRGLSLAVDWRTAPERLYLGTTFGVYASLDGGTTWLKSAGLPSVATPALVLDLVNGRLVAATHGRGMWSAAIDVTGPDVAVTSPAGGESWPIGSVRTVTWSASDPSGVGPVDVMLSGDDGLTYPDTIAAGVANTGSLEWTVGPTLTNAARVRVSARDGLGQPGSGASAAAFAIVTPAAVGPGAAVFALDPVVPGPGPGPFRVAFGLSRETRVDVDVYDASGRRLRSLASGPFGPGRHAVRWDGTDGGGAHASPGVYFVRLRGEGRAAVRRIALLR